MLTIKEDTVLLVLFSSIFIADAGREHFANETVEIVEFLVPRYPKAGDDVRLNCLFRLGGPKHRLYTVNWWRGRDQFYTYKTSNAEPKTSRIFKGIRVMVERSTAESVWLQRVSEDTSGMFRCEVMGEGPAFKTAVEIKRMTVVVPPSRVELTHKVRHVPRNVYEIDEHVQMNCTTHEAKPSPQIIWQINGVEVKRTEMKRFPDLYDHKGHVTSTLGLRFLAARYFINQRAKVSCIVSLQGHRFVQEEELLLNGSSGTFEFVHFSGVWGNCIGLPTSLVVTLMALHSLVSVL